MQVMKVNGPQKIKGFLLSLTMVSAGLMAASTSAHADASWIPVPTWSQLNVPNGDGVFQQNLRMFDDASVKLIDDPGQHSNVYIRTDVHGVTVNYDCRTKQGGASNILPVCANKTVQFGLELEGVELGNVKVTIDGVSVSDASMKKLGTMRFINKTTDENGQASIALGITNIGTTSSSSKKIAADDYLAVSISNCDRSTAASARACALTDKGAEATTALVGPMTLMFQDKGYYPQVKIVNIDHSDVVTSPNGCDPYAVRWAEGKTWEWSVFKRSWLGEYACVYIKSYQVGDTATVPYRVLDIWGTPMANQPVEFTHPSTPPNCGSVRCKWSSAGDSKYTDANGYVTFTVTNLNTPQDACLNQGYNNDTQVTGTCALGVGMNASTGMEPESQDLFWPQFANSMEIPDSSLDYYVYRRGPLTTAVDASGYPITQAVFGDGNVRNPALNINTTGESGVHTTAFSDSLVVSTINLKAFFNANPDTVCFQKTNPKNPAVVKRLPSTHIGDPHVVLAPNKQPLCTPTLDIYGPEVTVTATDGGRVLRTCPDAVPTDICRVAKLPLRADIKDVSQMKTTESFGYQNMSQLIFTSTKPGLATFTIDIGHQKYTVSQEFKTTSANIRSVIAVTSSQNGDVSGATKTVSFKVADRFGNGYAGVPVALTASGTNGATSPVNATSDANGLVSIDVAAPGTAGVGTVTATIQSQAGTQIGDSANADFSIPVSATSATSDIRWGALANTSAAKVTGAAKVGKSLKISDGTWTGATPTLSYTWYACSATTAASTVISAKCKVIAGATKSTYTVPKTQVGKFILAGVTATNAVTTGGLTSFSATTAKVAAK
jgi:hypothetical protein